MDQTFFLRAKRLLEQRPPTPVDHLQLTAIAVAQQATTPTARAHSRCASVSPTACSPLALASLLLAEPDWLEAAAGQLGCFSRAVAVRPVNTSETALTGIFTTAI